VAWLARTIDRLDNVGLAWLLLPNGLLALFVLIAHGGALILVRAGKPHPFGESFQLVYFSIPIAATAIVLALVAWAVPHCRNVVLKIHTFILGCVSAFALWFSLDVVAHGIPSGAFVWDPILFAFVLAYPTYLARRTLVPAAALRSPALRYAHVFAAILAILISVAVYWRMFTVAA
jgi:hypothetical protein